MKRFEDRVTVITGAASGIGRATAQRFGAEGARVVLADLNPDGASRSLELTLSAGAPDGFVSLCDVSREDQVVATLQAAFERFGRLDVVVNGAGLIKFKPLHELSEADWREVMGVDLMGAFFFIRHAFLLMQRGSAVVNVSSVHAVETTPGLTPYAAAKAALVALTRSAALEGRPKGIRVNAVLPGAIDTPMLWQNPNLKSGLERLGPNEIGKPADVAGAIAFLASDDAAFIQGAALPVDGGRLSEL